MDLLFETLDEPMSVASVRECTAHTALTWALIRIFYLSVLSQAIRGWATVLEVT